MLLEQINKDILTAMKSQDKVKLEALRLIKSALMNERVKQAVERLAEADEINVLSREVKQRKDSIAEFEKAGRIDLIEHEKSQLSIIESYLPPQLSKAEIIALIDSICVKNGYSTIKDMGKIMSALTPEVKGRADMTQVSALVKEYLK